MNKKTLLLLMSTVLASSLIPYNNQVYAKEYVYNHETADGAIIRRLPKDADVDNRDAWFKTGYGIDIIHSYFEYQEKTLDFERANQSFVDLCREIDEIPNKKKREETITKFYKILSNKLADNPFSARMLYQRAVFTKICDKNDDNYLVLLKKAIDIDKSNPFYLNKLAEFYLEKNETAKAIRILESIKKQYPREVEYRINLARAYSQYGQYNDAIREYRVAATFDPDNNDTIVALNSLYQYTQTNPYGSPNFYDPMKHVQTETRTQYAANQGTGIQNANYISKTQNFAPVYQNPSTKRVMVSYVNGRKVVKIVNVNSNQEQPVQNASETLNNQLEATNTNYNNVSNKETIKEQYTFSTKPASKSTTKPKQTVSTNTKTLKDNHGKYILTASADTQTTENKYEQKYIVNQKEYYTNNTEETPQTQAVQTQTTQTKPTNLAETNQYGDPSVKALSYNTAGRKQLLVTYKNGKKVVQMVSANGVPMSEIYAAQKQQKAEEKQQKIEEREQQKIEEKQLKIQEQQQKVEEQQQKEEEKTAKKEKQKAEKINKKEQTQQAINNKDNTDIYIKANDYLAQEQYQEAITELKKVQPATLRSLTAIASCYNSLGQTDTAIDYYKQADVLSPSNTQILYSIGYLYYSKNDKAQAKKYVDMALAVDETNQNALQLKRYMSQNQSNEVTNQAVTYMNQGNFNEAKRILDKSIKENANDFQSYYYLGHIGYATKKYEEAVANFAQAIKLNPEYALSYYSIGLAYDKLKEFNRSLTAYQQFLQIETDDNKYTQYAKTRINTIKSKQ